MEIWHLLNSMVSKYEAIPWLSEQNLGIEMQISKILLCQWFALEPVKLNKTQPNKSTWNRNSLKVYTFQFKFIST